MKKHQKIDSSYINKARRDYALYVLLARAIPALTDGLKAGTRRVMWVARDGKKWKSAALAGACMSLHPHASPEGSVDTLAAPFCNNIPLLHGIGSFGTRLRPTDYGASRYTSVIVSEFAKDVFYKDVEIVPMKDNYDLTLLEPEHFLPLVPIALLNGSSGVALGFASDVLPRQLSDIIKSQIKHLKGVKERNEPPITFAPTDSTSVSSTPIEDKVGVRNRWAFEGTWEQISGGKIKITNLPYGKLHSQFINDLTNLRNDKKIYDFEDGSSKNIDVVIKMSPAVLHDLIESDSVLDFLSLKTQINENMNMVDVDGCSIVNFTYHDAIARFSDWRLSFYVTRYERLRDLTQIDIQRLRDVITAIENDAGGKAKTTADRDTLKKWLGSIGIHHLDYIASLPVYRFTKEEKRKAEQEIKSKTVELNDYIDIINSPDRQRNIYIAELEAVNKKYGK